MPGTLVFGCYFAMIFAVDPVIGDDEALVWLAAAASLIVGLVIARWWAVIVPFCVALVLLTVGLFGGPTPEPDVADAAVIYALYVLWLDGWIAGGIVLRRVARRLASTA